MLVTHVITFPYSAMTMSRSLHPMVQVVLLILAWLCLKVSRDCSMLGALRRPRNPSKGPERLLTMWRRKRISFFNTSLVLGLLMRFRKWLISSWMFFCSVSRLLPCLDNVFETSLVGSDSKGGSKKNRCKTPAIVWSDHIKCRLSCRHQQI